MIEKNELLQLLIKDLIETIENFIDKSKDIQNIITLLNQNDFAPDLSVAVGLILYDSNEQKRKIKFELNEKDILFLTKNNISLNID